MFFPHISLQKTSEMWHLIVGEVKGSNPERLPLTQQQDLRTSPSESERLLHTNSIHWWESVFPNKTKYYSHEGQRGCRYEWSTPVKVFCLLREWDDVVQTVCHLCQETVGRSVTTVPPALSDAPKHEEAVTENHLDAARCSASEVGGHFFGDEY